MSAPARAVAPRESALPDAARMIASLPLAVLLISPDQTVAFINPAAEQLLGQSARKIVDKSVTRLISFDEPLILQRLSEGDAQVFARGSQVRFGTSPPRRLALRGGCSRRRSRRSLPPGQR